MDPHRSQQHGFFIPAYYDRTGRYHHLLDAKSSQNLSTFVFQLKRSFFEILEETLWEVFLCIEFFDNLSQLELEF